ncbi:Hypothetical protein [Arabidopsis thaliana]|uniref:F14M2.17 protein n=1 Tax=Arabidopsis thaliana TaxID=3702 RepID=Q9LQ23_ARATH|nr:Hypothetical protein [Arabidopsis thaliana]
MEGHRPILVVLTSRLTNLEDQVVHLNGVRVVLTGHIQCHTITTMVDRTRLKAHISDLPILVVILHNICLLEVDMVLVGNKDLHILVHMIITVGKEVKTQALCLLMVLLTPRQVLSRLTGRCMISHTMIILLCINLMEDMVAPNRAIHRQVVSTKCSSQVDLTVCKDQPSKGMGLQGLQHLLVMCLTKVQHQQHRHMVQHQQQHRMVQHQQHHHMVQLQQHHRMVQTWLNNSNMVMHQVRLLSKLILHIALQHHLMVIMVHNHQQLPQLMSSTVLSQLLVCNKLQVGTGKYLQPVAIVRIPPHSRLMVIPRLKAMETMDTLALSILAMEVETHQHMLHLLAKPLIPRLHLLRPAMSNQQLNQLAMQLLQEQHSDIIVAQISTMQTRLMMWLARRSYVMQG